MGRFAKFINTTNTLFLTMGIGVMTMIIAGCLLLLSIITPLYAQGVLWILQHLPLDNRQNLQNPTAIVVLGGGLTNDIKNEIVINQYTKTRLEYAKKVYETTKLPIIVSGKESPWMMQWLQQQGILWVVAEKNSFNTCENAKFTAETIKVKHVILITDLYHMTRARRQFLLNDISTVAENAPMPEPTSWTNPAQNINHARRATYELLAYFRDIFYPQSDCKSRN